MAPEDRQGQAYNEEAFHYFLGVEREHSDRSGLPFLLMLVDLQESPEVGAAIGPRYARQLFSALRGCIGETDFIGWYRHGRVVGAVLIDYPEASQTDASRLIRHRTMEALAKCLPGTAAQRLQLRIYRYPPPARSDSGGPQRG